MNDAYNFDTSALVPLFRFRITTFCTVVRYICFCKYLKMFCYFFGLGWFAPSHSPTYIWALVSTLLTGLVTRRTSFQCLVVTYCFSSPFLFILNNTVFSFMYTYLQNKRMRRCGVPPPPIIFERLKLPQQIIYRRKENLSESPNHQKYWENILVS